MKVKHAYTELDEKLDRIFHDAENADAGLDMAIMMLRLDKSNRMHLDAGRDLQAKRNGLVAEAAALDPERTSPTWKSKSVLELVRKIEAQAAV